MRELNGLKRDPRQDEMRRTGVEEVVGSGLKLDLQRRAKGTERQDYHEDGLGVVKVSISGMNVVHIVSHGLLSLIGYSKST